MRTLIISASILLAATRADAGPTFDANRSYDLRPMFAGSASNCIEIENTGIKNRPILAPCRNDAGQRWRLWATGSGYYKLTTELRGDRMCLANNTDKQPVLRPCRSDATQNWVVRYSRGAWQLTNERTGPNACLGLAGANDIYRPMLLPCGTSNDQRWKIGSRG